MSGLLAILSGGLVFGVGLVVSGLARQEVVLDFLRLDDLGLALTMLAALVVTLPIYRLCARYGWRPPLGPRFERFPRRVERKHVIGGIVFGIGWGVSGVCPGGALASLGLGNLPMLAGVAGMLVGAYLHGAMQREECTARPERVVRRAAGGAASASR